MKLIIQDSRRYVLKFKKGEVYPDAFIKFLKRKKIRGGFFVGLGACIDPEISVYDLKKKKYIIKKFRGDFEILNITGNVAYGSIGSPRRTALKRKGGKIVLHQHIALGSKNFGAIGGHLEKLVVAGTLEIFFIATPELKRQKDAQTGLNLLVD